MSDWKEADLLHWDEKIGEIAEGFGLDWHPIDYEIIDYQEMLGAMAYVGLPTHYRHWSYGKEYERTHTLYNMFADTNPDNIIDSFKSSAKYVRKLIEDPSIGIDRVEAILDAAHSVKYQVPRAPGITYKTHDELLQLEKLKMTLDPTYIPKLGKVPLRPEYNILKFIAEHSKHLTEWERNLILIVEESSKYFIPQALTKVMNEGWACTIHEKIINELNLPDNLYLPFISEDY